MTTVEAIVKEASRVPLYLPNVSALKEALRKAREWSDKVDQVQVWWQWKCRAPFKGIRIERSNRVADNE